MEKGKIIVIEGTDCSGKETQSKLLLERLNKEGIKCISYGFPDYKSPTGKIVGGPYLGKEAICEGWFEEGAPNVDAKVSCLYYAADRRYNVNNINEMINKGINVILDRYTYSNMAHQGGKILKKDKRLDMYKWISKLEFEMLELPRADIRIFLHMPYEIACILKKNRKERPDQNEASKEHLINAEKAYIEVSDIYNFEKIECSKNNIPRNIEEINDEIYNKIIKLI